jgi:hypothetical protein
MDRKSIINPFLLCPAIFLAMLGFSLFPSLCSAKKVTLGWNANSEPDLEGYVVYRNVGSPGPPYKYDDTLPEDDLANPLKPMVTLTGLNEHTEYYVAVTAYDTEGNESSFSNPICVEIEDALVQACSESVSPSTAKSSGGGGGSGGGGSVCFISSAGLKTSTSVTEPLFIPQPHGTFFAVLFLLFVAAARSVFSKQPALKE